VEYARTMRDALRRMHWWLSLTAGFGCLIVATWTGPVAMLVLFIVGCGLLFDGVTVLWAGTSRTGGLSDHRQ
jgi:hypothetical protein